MVHALWAQSVSACIGTTLRLSIYKLSTWTLKPSTLKPKPLGKSEGHGALRLSRLILQNLCLSTASLRGEVTV